MKKTWQEDVRARLKEIGITQKELAAKIRCSPSSLSEALSSPAKQSALVPAIHAAIGWDPPPDPQSPIPLPSSEAIEMGHLYDRLPDNVRKKLRDDAQFYLRLSSDDEK